MNSQARLFTRGGSKFFSFADAYSSSPVNTMPYAYFSSYGQRNGYAKYLGAITPATTPATFKILDCDSLGVYPYFEAGNLTNPTACRYYKPQGYQIICAGENRQFGVGTLWTPATASAISAAGKDDQTNFNGGSMMGVGN